MALHSKNIAITAGVPTNLVEEAAKYMVIHESIRIDTAYDYLKAFDVFSIIRKNEK